ncbi:MAG: hypothetical protein JWO38_5711 [Gemmataceae bacterium]|nr:hypothetical protein [Gemmataceae bacterium]
MAEVAPSRDPGRRSRRMYILAALAVVAVGLWSRSDAAGLPWSVAKYAGDALWGLVVFLGTGLLLPRLTTPTAAGLAAAFACAVEASQLYHAPWLDAVRGTRPGGLVLGTPAATFAWADIAAYLAGTAAGAVAERATGSRAGGRRAPPGGPGQAGGPP